MNIRENYEKLEKEILSPYATLSFESKGRVIPEDKCDIRTDFQRDRDRIIHSKSFRRLKHKTQVFIAPEGDHYRTRLTHTLEVSQIARTIARALRLNEDLTEAIALGHDLGHTPFGHTGENVLNEICSKGFEHNEQSLRVVDVLENNKGMNLTYEVRDGILNHCGENTCCTLEGGIVKYADRIAYINHDIDDAIRGNIISNSDIPSEFLNILGHTHSKRINTMITDIINFSIGKDFILMSPEIQSATDKIRQFMFDKVYIGSRAKSDENKARYVVTMLFEHFNKNTGELPEEFKQRLQLDDKECVVCDYIAGMTDIYAVNLFNKLFIPSPWR
ncbi:deoxyguanosinetriphosphate triphosphohydrolase [Oxobacter pfennigii]|uniref:Deoxyguanosinetriphosphate triphosphohydrolase-like protein n=1 Tax=Oxobacter pfennigii TaxID=36849 RepID=A0A0P8W7S3_9CLOT|nr:deoxyguanosinetriphosphate triphosphohydrolase [Oxobacter pfennigii]KPU44090.1 deoxyguanosinetriphosphate triphosphohydrolase [Oxobacter pfennigii]